jgi:hypothetical protein
MACNNLVHVMQVGDVGGDKERKMGATPRLQERSEFDEPDYALIDTLFSLAEAHLFMQARPACQAGPRLRCLAPRRPRGSRRLHACLHPLATLFFFSSQKLSSRVWPTPLVRAPLLPYAQGRQQTAQR